MTGETRAETESELQSCPACGAGIPVVSKVCAYCGHHLEGLIAATAGSLQRELERSIDELERAVRIGPWALLRRHYYLIIPALTLMAAMATRAMPGVGAIGIITGLLFTASYLIIAGKTLMFAAHRADAPPEDAEESLRRAAFERHARSARAYFGADAKVRQSLQAFHLRAGQMFARRARNATIAFSAVAILVAGFLATMAWELRLKYAEAAPVKVPLVTVSATTLEGPLAEHWQLVPAEVPLRRDPRVGDVLSVRNVKFVVKARVRPGSLPQRMHVEAVLLDAAGRKVARLAPWGFELSRALEHEAHEVFVTFLEATPPGFAMPAPNPAGGGWSVKLVSFYGDAR